MPDNVRTHKPSHRYERSTVTIRGLSFVAYGLVFGGYGGLVAVVALFGLRGYPGRYLGAPFILALVRSDPRDHQGRPHIGSAPRVASRTDRGCSGPGDDRRRGGVASPNDRLESSRDYRASIRVLQLLFLVDRAGGSDSASRISMAAAARWSMR